MGEPAARLSLDDVLNDPSWFAFGYDPASRTIGFVEASADDLARAPFLDGRWDRRGRRNLRLPVAALSPLSAPDNLRLIWHTGFCCSTLLAQALNAPGCNLSLSEPKLLVDAADAKRAGADLTGIAFRLLARAAAPAVTLKPAPAANNLMRDTPAGSRHLVLHGSCESFVVSLAKLGCDGERYVRDMLSVMARNGARFEAPPSPLHAAALLWQLQMAELHAQGATRMLDAESFLADPEGTIAMLDDHFALGLPADHFEHVRPLFARNAKNPAQRFDAESRDAEHRAARAKWGSALNDAVSWSERSVSA
ncbi:MAG TPA: hypothetical protein VG889_21935 [Rhizomicrobium sp.]|nr:hypothetical protein [Rhizomicrobium sp.]